MAVRLSVYIAALACNVHVMYTYADTLMDGELVMTLIVPYVRQRAIRAPVEVPMIQSKRSTILRPVTLSI